MLRIASGVAGIALLACTILIIAEAAREIQRTYDLGGGRLASYLLSLLVGLCFGIGGAYLCLRYALGRHHTDDASP